MSQNYRLSRKCNEEGYKYIYDSIEKTINNIDSNPIVIGKIGSNELLIIYQTLCITQNKLNDFSPNIIREGVMTAGIYPASKERFISFVKLYLNAISSMNIMASWNDNILEVEEYVWDKYILEPSCLDNCLGIVELGSLESFYTESKYWWQNLYQHKTILVISPFVNSFQIQLNMNKRDKVWKGRWNGFWSPNINFKYIKFPHPYYISSNKEKSNFPESIELLIKKYQNEIDSIGHFDIALIGTGAYSILLCDYIKTIKGKNAFHLGGGLQMMFGVYGHRWDPSFNNSTFLKEYINDDWIRPLPEEIPMGYKSQENGAYF